MYAPSKQQLRMMIKITPASHSRLLRWAFVSLLAILLSSIGCGKDSIRVAAPVNQANQNGSAQPQTSRSTPPGVADMGDFTIRFQTPKKNYKGPAPKRPLIDKQYLERLVSSLNESLALRVDVNISFEDCKGDEGDAYYEDETHQIVICYALVEDYQKIFARKIKDRQKLKDAVEGAVVSTMFHELGHAVIDVWSLPVTGKEEDAADQISTLTLLDRSERGEEMALTGALSFMLFAELDKGEEKIYWDEHSLDEQRFYDNICLIYGKDPEKYSYLVRQAILPEERAAICPEEFARIKRSWETLLAPYVK
jgi:hypothetical protein